MRRRRLIAVAAVASAALLAFGAAGWGVGRVTAPDAEEAFADGRRDGLRDGRVTGLAVGRRQGRQTGLIGGRAEGRRSGLADGRRAGRAAGLEAGREQGLEEGYENGYAEGRGAGVSEGRNGAFAVDTGVLRAGAVYATTFTSDANGVIVASAEPIPQNECFFISFDGGRLPAYNCTTRPDADP